MTPRPSQRDAIMCAALACFARNGYDATRIKHIAEEAGVSDGALYRHFTSKEQLARELYEYGLHISAQALAAATQGAGTPLEALRQLARATLTGYRDHPDVFVYGLLQAPPAAAADLHSEGDLPLDVIARFLEQGQADGSVRSGDPRVLSAAFLGCLVQPIAISRSTPGCVPDLFADDSHDGAIIESAVGSVAAR
jgi:AcrR family transcriptional regulator